MNRETNVETAKKPVQTNPVQPTTAINQDIKNSKPVQSQPVQPATAINQDIKNSKPVQSQPVQPATAINQDIKNSKPVQSQPINNRKPVQTQGENELYTQKNASQLDRPKQGKIKKRELWWQEKPSEFQIPEAKPFLPPTSSSGKVDHKNFGFQPAAYNGKKIETQKLNWEAKPVVDTWGNITHKPGGFNFFLYTSLICYLNL